MNATAVGREVRGESAASAQGTRRGWRRTRGGWALLWTVVAVVAADWASKAAAWRLLPGRAIINADTSGAVPVLPGLISQPIAGSLVDAAVLVLLAVSGLWLSRTPTLHHLTWYGCALAWAGAGANAADRWFGHFWLAPGSRRGVVDWIAVPGVGTANLADLIICVGVLAAVFGLAFARLPRRLFVAVAAGVVILVPVSLQTTTGSVGNAVAPQPSLSFEQQMRRVLWIGSSYSGRRVLWRDWRQDAGWNLTVEAVDADGRVLERWRLPWENPVEAILLPEQTDVVYVHSDDTGRAMTLASGLA